MVGRMNNAVDYDGNTPMHIAAMKGYTSIVRDIWVSKRSRIAEKVHNNKGLTPFEISRRQLAESEYSDGAKISKYLRIGSHKFTTEWFDDVVGSTIVDKWQKIQVIGLGSVLITTVSFAACITIPGGYDQEQGTPILERNYVFRAFIMANSLAFIQVFASLLALLGNATEGPTHCALAFAIQAFALAASSMVLAFGLGMYVTIAAVSSYIATFILNITMWAASPALFYAVIGQNGTQTVYMLSKPYIWIMYCVSNAIIFGLAFS